METLDFYRQTIKQILRQYEGYKYANSLAKKEVVFDEANDRYLLIAFGREADRRRTHGIIVHVEIIDGKIWIQYDGLEEGMANELVNAGIPKDKIVLGFKAPEMRSYTEFAVT
ncbi:MAG TPA: XisI protein [Blastocatellia bacterium]|nr:XisI protein [Blastocatellia bacterium]